MWRAKGDSGFEKQVDYLMDLSRYSVYVTICLLMFVIITMINLIMMHWCRQSYDINSEQTHTQDRQMFGWLGSLVAKALDLQLEGCDFNSRPRRCRVTTLGKLFKLTCLSRSQWFSDGMIDCGVRGRGQLCLSRQPLRCKLTALGSGCAPFLQCLGRLSLPPSVGR